MPSDNHFLLHRLHTDTTHVIGSIPNPLSLKSRVERDGSGCYGKRSQKWLWNHVVAASFGGLGTGAILGGKAGCGRVSEEVGTFTLTSGLCPRPS